jgi:putative endopeptidase
MAFETRLAEASYPAEKMRDVQLTMNRHEVAALDELMPQFGLTGYAEKLGVTLPTVNVDNPGFFRELQKPRSPRPRSRRSSDYLRWHLVVVLRIIALSPEFENEAFDFYGRRIGGQQEMRPRWKRMLDAATADIGEAVAQLYVDAAFSEQAEAALRRDGRPPVSAMGSSIRNAEWMTETTKRAGAREARRLRLQDRLPDEWRDYSALEIGRDSFAANRMRAAAFEYDREFGRLASRSTRAEWAMPAHQVNAYYHPLLNEVVFPAGILQPPFFYAEADDAVNFGAIGAVIGHEITHGFDDRGSQFDADGALRNWWTDEDRAEFDRRAEVLVEQFGGYEVLEGLNINGRLSLGENIADLGGVTVAYNALLEALGDDKPLIDGYTPEQRFFLAYATMWRINHTDEQLRMQVSVHPHSPGPLPRERRGREPAGVRGGVRHPAGLADGEPGRAAREDLVADCREGAP